MPLLSVCRQYGCKRRASFPQPNPQPIGTRLGIPLIVHCPTSKFRTSAESFPLTCPSTGDPLEFTDFVAFQPDLIDPSLPGQWRYLPWLQPYQQAESFITLGEGWTPLLKGRWCDRNVLWKVDSDMPTGSYKDRGVSVMVNWFRHYGFQTVMDDSSGNAGASLACYAARAELHARIFVPAAAPGPKKSQIAIYGAELVEVEGPRSLVAAAATAALSHDVGYASHALHPAFLLGQMSVAWEIWEQMGYRAPTWLAGPAGNGGLMLGAWRGFELLAKSGLITELPRLIVVQAQGFDPLHKAFEGDYQTVNPMPNPPAPSVADGISIVDPSRGQSLLTAIYQSRGFATSVNDDDILAAQREMAGLGFFVEPTSAAACAALTRHIDIIDEAEDVVVILSGTGLKNPPLV